MDLFPMSFIQGLNNESLWNVVIGRDVIVPVINAKNPFLDEINLHGVSPELLSVFVKNAGLPELGGSYQEREKSEGRLLLHR